MEKLKITHSTGFLELNVDSFFPCTNDKAKKVFKLMQRWSEPEIIEELKVCLQEKADFWNKAMKTASENGCSYSPKFKGYKDYLKEFKSAQSIYNRCIRNIKCLEEICN